MVKYQETGKQGLQSEGYKERRGEAENYRAVSLTSILGNKFEMILMDELNDTFGEVQLNRSESAWIHQRQSCQKQTCSFLG